MEVLVSGQEAPCCPLGFFPPSGWPRSQTWSTQSVPVQRPAACLPGPLTGLAFPGDPSITPAKWMQRAMAPLKRQTSPRFKESEGSCIQHPVSTPTPTQFLPTMCHAALCWRKSQITAPAQDLPGVLLSANPSSDSRKLAYSPCRRPHANANSRLN